MRFGDSTCGVTVGIAKIPPSNISITKAPCFVKGFLYFLEELCNMFLNSYDNIYPIRILKTDHIKLRTIASDAYKRKYRISSCGIVRCLIRQFVNLSPLERDAMLHLWVTSPEYKELAFKRATNDDRVRERLEM